MDVWVQESLFDVEPSASHKPGQTGRAGYSPAKGRRADWSRVTRDPAVATSYAETTKVAVDFRLGLARALAQLTADQRQALRATVERPTKRRAA